MRKDVKLGFAVGGVLLAVLIVYVLVVPGGKDQRLSDAQGEAQADGGVKLEPVAPDSKDGAVAQNTQPPPAPPVTFDPPAGGTDPFEQPTDEAVASNNPARTDLDWSKLLNDPRAPVLMATPEKPSDQTASAPAASGAATPQLPDITKPGPTPIVSPVGESSAPKADEAAVPPPVTADAPVSQPPSQAETPAPPAQDAPVAVDPPSPGSETPIAGTTTDNAPNAPSAPAAAQQVHTVESGDSFSSIAIRYYSNPNLYPALMRANPSIDPVKLRPGMKVVVPPLNEIRPAAPAADTRAAGTPVSGDTAQVSSTRVEAPIDPATQYRVQTGDSLYSIAKKLYGRGDRSTKLYEANKAAIGEDINRLKVGQVLQLPDPPTNLQAPR